MFFDLRLARTAATKCATTAPRQGRASRPASSQHPRQQSFGFPEIPASACRRFERMLEVEGLRSWRPNGFPLSLWHSERERHVEVVRLIGQRMEALWIDIEHLESDTS